MSGCSRNVMPLDAFKFSSKMGVVCLAHRENIIPGIVVSLEENCETLDELETIVAVAHGRLCSIYKHCNTGNPEDYCEGIYALIKCCLTTQSIIHNIVEENTLLQWAAEVKFVERVRAVLTRAYYGGV